MSFDANGNITHKSDLGAFTLKYGGEKEDGIGTSSEIKTGIANGALTGPHALTSISGVPSCFPQAEQPTYPTAELSVTYTDFKKIATLTEKNKYYELTYGVDDQRRMSVYKVNGQTQLTRYYLGNYEEEITPDGKVRKIHYLSGAILIQNEGKADSLLYTYSDAQGSLIALTDVDGNLVRRYAYDPWGARRNPDNWNEKDNCVNLIINRGYTGHEHLDAFGIINMNGRVYDPLTAMFFSPDPFLQDPDNWLNYNRYGYCFGNPLRYSDPTGLLTWNDVIAGVALVGGIVLECVPGMQWLGTSLIVAGFSHFALTIDQVQNSHGQTSWDQASTDAGFQFGTTIDINGPTAKEKNSSKGNNISSDYPNVVKPKWNGKFFTGTEEEAKEMLIEGSKLFGMETSYYWTSRGFYFLPTSGNVSDVTYDKMSMSIIDYNNHDRGFMTNDISTTRRYFDIEKNGVGGWDFYPTNIFDRATIYYQAHTHPNNTKYSGGDLTMSHLLRMYGIVYGWNGSTYIYKGYAY